jgi:RNA polymerase sigma-70 factor, ECF subfamily
MTYPIGTSRESIGSTSSSLLIRVKARNQDAWQRLVRLYGPLVDFWLRQANLQPADTRDVFQEVFKAVADGIGSFRKDRPCDRFRGWLRTITRNKLADHFRRQGWQPAAVGGSSAYQRLQEVEGPAEVEDEPQELYALKQLRLRAVDLIRGEFETRTWQAFYRVTVEGQAAKDVAEDMGVTPSAVRLAKSRVLRRLREEMEELEEV